MDKDTFYWAELSNRVDEKNIIWLDTSFCLNIFVNSYVSNIKPAHLLQMICTLVPDRETDMNEKLIYIVDDDKVILHLLEYTFKSRGGYEVKTFSSGEDLLKGMDQMPDLVVLDHLFQDKMSGLETLKELRKTSTDLPVIILTGQNDSELKKEFIRNGAFSFINKSDYFIDTIIESVETIFPN